MKELEMVGGAFYLFSKRTGSLGKVIKKNYVASGTYEGCIKSFEVEFLIENPVDGSLLKHVATIDAYEAEQKWEWWEWGYRCELAFDPIMNYRYLRQWCHNPFPPKPIEFDWSML